MPEVLREIQIGDDVVKTDLPAFTFRGKEVEGAGNAGMAVRIATEDLAAEVAGVANGISILGLTGIAGAKRGTPNEEFKQANVIAARNALRDAKTRANGRGLVGGNALSKDSSCDAMCLDEEVAHTADLLFVGAGVERQLYKDMQKYNSGESVVDPGLFKEMQARYGSVHPAIIVPIASTVRMIKIAYKSMQNAGYKPNEKPVFYLELADPERGAAGHIGIPRAEHYGSRDSYLDHIAEELHQEGFRSEVRIILGGGVMDYKDRKQVYDFGFDATLSGTAFVNTHESGASATHKKLISEAKSPDDVIAILSGTGFWAHALKTPHIMKWIESGRVQEITNYLAQGLDEEGRKALRATREVRDCVTNCLGGTCGFTKISDKIDPQAGDFCIYLQLLLAIQGHDAGLYFASKQAYRVGPTIPAAERMRMLLEKTA